MSRRGQVDPIRIGGKDRQPALSLDHPLPLLKPGGKARMKVATVTPARVIDWPETLRRAGFDADESEFIQATRLESRSCSEMAVELGWTAAKARSVQLRCWRKLAFPIAPNQEPCMQTPSGVAFVEKFPSGHQTWSITPANPVEPFVMRLERTNFFSESST